MAQIRFKSRRVITPFGERGASIHVDQGVISAIHEYACACASEVTHDFGDRVIMPGLVDAHVHINEPGRTEWEGFSTATRAAAAGGVTTIIDMPLNSVPATTTVAALHMKQDAAAGQCQVDVGFWGGLVPGNLADLSALHAAGVFGFKCFMTDSGVPEFDWVGPHDLHRAAPIIKELDALLLAHAEWPEIIDAAWHEVLPAANLRSYDDYARSRPPDAEVRAIEFLIELARRHGCRVHVVHLSAAEALGKLDEARAEGLPVTVETCPHYLMFAAEEIVDGATAFKCAPPIRDYQRSEELWDGLRRGSIDIIVSDHSPAPPELKLLEVGDFSRAWGGIASLQLGLNAVWTGAGVRGADLSDVAQWMCAGPAQLLRLQNKGVIEVGRDADLVVLEPDGVHMVDARQLQHRHKITPYDGMFLRGEVQATFLRGEAVYEHGEFSAPRGQLLQRTS
ncbi:MAG TPA: allantoinase AllB [Longimicrobiales bacterium]|nr:allantoinase AllB [Longimicrobiales bacterium]